jgi:hypothetical protein
MTAFADNYRPMAFGRSATYEVAEPTPALVLIYNLRAHFNGKTPAESGFYSTTFDI